MMEGEGEMSANWRIAEVAPNLIVFRRATQKRTS